MFRTIVTGIAILAWATIGLAEPKTGASVIKLTPEAYAVEVKSDEKAAAKKYKGKTIEFTSKIAGINRNASGDVFLSLPSKTAGILGVSCFLKDKNVFGKVVKGQEVTVRGRYPDLQFGTQIMDCEIVKKGPSPALTYTAESFATEWTKDKSAAEKKWKDKTIIVSGLIVEAKIDDFGVVNVYLKAGPQSRVDCGFSAFEKDLATKLETGQQVTVVGEFLESQSKDNQPALRFCMPAGK